MLEVLIGVISGTVSGMGMGGGTILILILTLFLNVEQHVAQATNLFFFVPTAIAATIINYKQKIIDIKIAVVIAIYGIIGAVIGSNIANNLDSNILKKIFGIFLLIIAINEIVSYKKMNIKKGKKP